jgi:hypothetical protein
LRTAGADFSSAWSDFKALGTFFCNSATLSFLRLVSRSRAWSVARPCTTSCGFEASETYHFRARIQSFQAVAAPFPGDSILPSRPSRAAIPATETPRFKRSTLGLEWDRGARTNIELPRSSGKKFVERLGNYTTVSALAVRSYEEAGVNGATAQAPPPSASIQSVAAAVEGRGGIKAGCKLFSKLFQI